MDESTEGVTLLSGFVFDVLTEFEHMKGVCGPVFEKTAHLDSATPEALTEMALYNDTCAWIEENVGTTNVRRAGVAIGDRAFDAIVEQNKMREPSPLGMMEALQWAAANLIHDPKGRGWEILDSGPKAIRMRRTQTFNCVLQEGLLRSLVERTGCQSVRVTHARCTREGDEFCEYDISWVRESS